jgi:hypothetical protein
MATSTAFKGHGTLYMLDIDMGAHMNGYSLNHHVMHRIVAEDVTSIEKATRRERGNMVRAHP